MDINLLPWRQLKYTQQIRWFLISLWGWLGLILFLVVILHFYLKFHIYKEVNDCTELSRAIQSILKIKNQLVQEEKEFLIIKDRNNLFKNFILRKSLPVDFLTKISAIFPNNMRLIELHYNNCRVGLIGYGENSIEVSNFIKNLKKQWTDVQLKQLELTSEDLYRYQIIIEKICE